MQLLTKNELLNTCGGGIMISITLNFHTCLNLITQAFRRIRRWF